MIRRDARGNKRRRFRHTTAMSADGGTAADIVEQKLYEAQKAIRLPVESMRLKQEYSDLLDRIRSLGLEYIREDANQALRDENYRLENEVSHRKRAIRVVLRGENERGKEAGVLSFQDGRSSANEGVC
jgi:hypothetical protein